MITGKWDNVLKIPEGQSGSHKIEHFKTVGKVAAHTLRTAMFGQKTQFIDFDGERSWHKLTYDGGTWMTDLPVEQRQCDEAVAHIAPQSRILVGGLGLGYVLTKLVKEYDPMWIDVVEISKDVINLVWPYLDDDVKKKTSLWNKDLFAFLKEDAKIQPDWEYGFFDIWQSDSETTFHTTVVPLRKLARDYCGEIICWNEDVMRGQLFQALQTRYFMLSQPISGIDPDKLREYLVKKDDVYTAWAAPFWEQFGFNNLSDMKTFMDEARNYVDLYEIEEDWLHDWSSCV